MATLVDCDCCPIRLKHTHAYLPPGPAFTRDFGTTGQTILVPNTKFQWLNWAGSGVDVTLTSNFNVGPGATSLVVGPTGGGARYNFAVAFSQPVYLRRLQYNDLDFRGPDEAVYAFQPQLTGVDGQHQIINAGAAFANPADYPAVRGSTANPTGGILFGGQVTSTLNWSDGQPGGAGAFIQTMSFDLIAPRPAIAMQCTPGGPITWVDAETGDPVAPGALVDW